VVTRKGCTRFPERLITVNISGSRESGSATRFENVTGIPSAPLYLKACIALSKPKNALTIRAG
jgi:hypothetical protein